MGEIKFNTKSAKSILNVKKGIDSWFWDRYSINPYNGCSFGCVYCDARSTHYYMPEDFENNIQVKENPHLLLDKRLLKARTLLPDVVGIGGVTDSYQPAEKIYENTRKILEVLHKYQYPIHLATKSPLIERDLDLIQSIAENSWATISVSISSTKKEVADFLDFRSPAPSKRFELIKSIKKHCPAIQAGVLLIPMVPYLSDSPEDLEDMVQRTVDSGADYLLFSGMTMHDAQAKWFLKKLEEAFPELIPKYQSLFKFQDSKGQYKGLSSTPTHYLRQKEQRLLELCTKHNLNTRIKRFIPDDFRKWNYIVAEKLLNAYYYQQISGHSSQELFWAAHNIHKLKESIKLIAERGELASIWNLRGEVLRIVEECLHSAD